MSRASGQSLCPSRGPGDLFDHTPPQQMKQTLIRWLIQRFPALSPAMAMHYSAGHTAHGNKPAILEVGNSAARGDPNSPAIVLKKGLHGIIRQSTVSLAVNRNLPVFPSVQAIVSAKPDAAIPGRQNGPDGGVGQTLLHGNRGDGEVAKTVEAITRGDPNIAFTILKES